MFLDNIYLEYDGIISDNLISRHKANKYIHVKHEFFSTQYANKSFFF